MTLGHGGTSAEFLLVYRDDESSCHSETEGRESAEAPGRRRRRKIPLPPPEKLNLDHPGPVLLGVSSRVCNSISERAPSRRSAFSRDISTVIGLGTATQNMPALLAATTPLRESSMATARSGDVRSRSNAATYRSGAGLILSTSSPVTTQWKRASRPRSARCPSTQARVKLEATPLLLGGDVDAKRDNLVPLLPQL